MYKLVEGMSGIEVVADDFIIIGCETTIEEATTHHDKVLLSSSNAAKNEMSSLTLIS